MPGASAPIRRTTIGRTTSSTIAGFATDSIGPLVPSPVAELLADLAVAFTATGIRWYLFGAQAAIAYGVARLTADVDVTVAPPPGPTNAWLTAIERHGFRRRVMDEAFVARTQVVPVVHVATGLPVDIVLAGPGLEQEFLDRAATQSIDGVAVPVVDLADLVVLKILAGRPKDLDDVTALLTLHRERLDDARVRSVLGMLEDALGQSDLLASLDHCWSRVRT